MLGTNLRHDAAFQRGEGSLRKSTCPGSGKPEVITDYADIVAMTNNGSLIGKPLELINKALRLIRKTPRRWHWQERPIRAEEDTRTPPHIGKDYWCLSLRRKPNWRSRLGTASRKPNPWHPVKAVRLPERLISRRAARFRLLKNKPDQRLRPARLPRGTLSGKVTLSPALAGKVSPNDSLYVFAGLKRDQGHRWPPCASRSRICRQTFP